MFEPKIQHNRDEFESLNRRKRRWLIALLAGVIPVSVVAGIAPARAEYVVVVFLALVGGTVLFFELKKTLVYKRDLRERRDDVDKLGEMSDGED